LSASSLVCLIIDLRNYGVDRASTTNLIHLVEINVFWCHASVNWSAEYYCSTLFVPSIEMAIRPPNGNGESVFPFREMIFSHTLLLW